MISEYQHIVTTYRQVDFSRRRAALATVVKLTGSGYRRPGARMLITDDGQWTGAISGGCLEGDALRKAREVMQSGEARVVVYDTTNDENDNFGIGLGCNGILDVLIEPIDPTDAHNPLELLDRLIQDRHPAAMATVVRAEPAQPVRVGDRLALFPDGTYQPAADRPQRALLHELAERSLETESPAYHEAPDVTVFVEYFRPDIQLLVFGGGYDAVPLVRLAKRVGWSVIVADDCVAHLTPKRFGEADQLLAITRGQVRQQVPINQYAAAVLISHNYKLDKAVLAELLQTDIPYIGLLGPKKRGNALLNELAAEGITADPARVFSPVGLDINADSPPEIALSILAEIQAVFRGASAQPLKFKNAPIHQ